MFWADNFVICRLAGAFWQAKFMILATKSSRCVGCSPACEILDFERLISAEADFEHAVGNSKSVVKNNFTVCVQNEFRIFQVEMSMFGHLVDFYF